jgi:hypothetical protein
METFDEIVETEEPKTLIDMEYLNKIEVVDEIEVETPVVQETEAPVRARRGLLALASEFESNRVTVNEINHGEEEIKNLDIVSPFSSMFSSLSNGNKVEADN